MYMSSQATQENEVDMHNPIQLISSAYIITDDITRQINIYNFEGKQYAFYISSGANGVLAEGTLFPFYGTTAKSGHRFVKASQFESSTLSAWKSTLVAQPGCNALKSHGTDSILRYFKSFEELQISAAFGSKIWDTNHKCVPFILYNDYIGGSFTPREQPIPDNSGLKEVVIDNREIHDYDINGYLRNFGFHTEIDLDTKVNSFMNPTVGDAKMEMDLPNTNLRFNSTNKVKTIMNPTNVRTFMNPTFKKDAEVEHYKGIRNRVERNQADDLEVQRNNTARQAKFSKNRKLGGGYITRKRTKRRYSKKRSKRRNRNRKSNRKKHR